MISQSVVTATRLLYAARRNRSVMSAAISTRKQSVIADRP